MQSFTCCVITMPTQPSKLILSLFLPHFKKSVVLENAFIQQQPKKKQETAQKIDLFFSFFSGLLLSCFQSATWCWSPATPVTCPAVWTGSTSRSTLQKITWWFCARQRWPLNRREAYLGLMHRENRQSRANTDKKQRNSSSGAWQYVHIFVELRCLKILHSVDT